MGGILVTMMYARTEFIYAVLLVASFLIEGSQATFQVEAAIGPTRTYLSPPWTVMFRLT